MGRRGCFLVDHVRASVDGCTGGRIGFLVDPRKEGDISEHCYIARLLRHLRLCYHRWCCRLILVYIIIITTIGGAVVRVVIVSTAIVIVIFWPYIGGAPGV